MAFRGGRGGGAPVMREQPPINIVFKFLTAKSIVQIWLYENLQTRIEGQIIGFDEFMNVVVDRAMEVKVNPKPEQKLRVPLGTIVLRGDNISLIHSAHDSM